MNSLGEKSKWKWDEGWRSFAALILGFSLLPFVMPYTSLATEILCLSLLAISFNLLFGYVGLLSFCHAAFFSIGAYTVGNLIIHFQVPVLVGILAGGVLAAVIAVPIGAMSIRRLGIYFAFLTLAFNEMVYYIIYESVPLTGGDEGLRGITRPNLNLGFWTLDLSHALTFYFFVLALFALCFWAMRRIVNSPFGRVIKSIKENENRAEAIGFRIKHFKLMVVIISAFFAGISGALHTLYIRFADVEHCVWIFSGDVVLMTLLGGIKSLIGPVFGVFAFVFLSDSLSALWERWLFIMGIIFLISVLFFRDGIQGIFEILSRLLFPKKDHAKGLTNHSGGKE
jgi:branched-chain amino acid transport system permease protein